MVTDVVDMVVVASCDELRVDSIVEVVVGVVWTRVAEDELSIDELVVEDDNEVCSTDVVPNVAGERSVDAEVKEVVIGLLSVDEVVVMVGVVRALMKTEEVALDKGGREAEVEDGEGKELELVASRVEVAKAVVKAAFVIVVGVMVAEVG